MEMVLGLLAGALGWTASEYLLHRFAGHGAIRRRPGPRWWLTPRLPVVLFHEEHVAHHRDPTYFAPGWKKALAALLLVPAGTVLAGAVTNLGAGAAFGAGFAGAYLAYERLHRRIHTHAPLNRYFAWMRRHHLHHHVAPRTNHGVTSPGWDRVFGTLDEVRPVRLPRALAPAWLLDARGAVRGEYEGDYVLGSSGREGARP